MELFAGAALFGVAHLVSRDIVRKREAMSAVDTAVANGPDTSSTGATAISDQDFQPSGQGLQLASYTNRFDGRDCYLENSAEHALPDGDRPYVSGWRKMYYMPKHETEHIGEFEIGNVSQTTRPAYSQPHLQPYQINRTPVVFDGMSSTGVVPDERASGFDGVVSTFSANDRSRYYQPHVVRSVTMMGRSTPMPELVAPMQCARTENDFTTKRQNSNATRSFWPDAPTSKAFTKPVDATDDRGWHVYAPREELPQAIGAPFLQVTTASTRRNPEDMRLFPTRTPMPDINNVYQSPMTGTQYNITANRRKSNDIDETRVPSFHAESGIPTFSVGYQTMRKEDQRENTRAPQSESMFTVASTPTMHTRKKVAVPASSPWTPYISAELAAPRASSGLDPTANERVRYGPTTNSSDTL